MKNNLSLIFFAIIIFGMLSINSVMSFFSSDYVLESNYPVKAVEYIKSNLDYENIRMYNAYGIGSYLGFNGINCFIDSRAELFDSKDVTILQDLYDMEIMKITCNELFEKYDLEYALIAKDNYLNTYVENCEDYMKIYEDEYYYIYKLSE